MLLKADGFVCGLFNKVRLVKSVMDFSNKRIIKRNVRFKDSAVVTKERKVCFVLGNGPSVNKESLNRLAKYPTFTVNFFHKGNYGFRSNYHIMIDPGFSEVDSYIEYTHDTIQKETETSFFLSEYNGKRLYGTNCNIPDNVFFLKSDYLQHGDHIHYEMSKVMSESPNVIPTVIQCAIYMGYSEIFLLGCEFGLYGYVLQEMSGHHYDTHKLQRERREHDSPECLIRCALVHRHHEAIVKFCDMHNIRIENLTPVTNLGEYDLNSLDSVLNELDG